jgi:glutaredoxin
MKIYSKPDCPYCVKAKELLDSRGIFYEEILVGTDVSADEYKNMIPGFTTVPGIYIDNCFIGGYTELLAYFKNRS